MDLDIAQIINFHKMDSDITQIMNCRLRNKIVLGIAHIMNLILCNKTVLGKATHIER